MKRITHAWLVNQEACPEDRKLFRELYPKGIEVCWECFREAQRKGLDVEWLAGQLDYDSWSAIVDLPTITKHFPKLEDRFPNMGGWTVEQLSTKGLKLLEKYLHEGRFEDPSKADFEIGQRHRLGYFMNFTRYRNELGQGGPPGVPLPLWNGETVTFDSDVYRFSHDLTLSPAVLNHFVIGGNLFNKLSGSPNLDKG